MNTPSATTPTRRFGRWFWIILALLLGTSLTAGYRLALKINGNARAELSASNQALSDTREEAARLRSRMAIIERGTEVTAAANKRLREELATMERELTESRESLEFYRRLLSQGLEQGLGVHELKLFATASQRVFRFELTLAMNSRYTGLTRGNVSLAIQGIREDRPARLDLSQLLTEDSGEGAGQESLPYEFRYFQQLSGNLVLPDGFEPEQLIVVVKPQGRGDTVERNFDWADVLSA